MALTTGSDQPCVETTTLGRLSVLSPRSIDLELDARGRPRNPLLVLDLNDHSAGAFDRAAEILGDSRPGIVVGLSDHPLPDTDSTARLIRHLDVVLAPAAPHAAHAGSRADLETICAQVVRSPVAATALIQVLRLTPHLDVSAALLVESFAYSTLLGGEEFRRWLATRPHRAIPGTTSPPVVVNRDGSALHIVLSRPERRNAFSASMRDALVEALTIPVLDPSISDVVVRGEGPSFCSGGDLDEFGTSSDLAGASLIRTTQSAARRVSELGDRVRFRTHGACVGAGIEVPSFAARVEAMPGTWFQLPELAMGLIPGAGGTVGLPRRIGRWRTAFMALTGARIDVTTAHAWGLVDAIV